MNSLISNKTVKIRKEHRCCLCHRKFEKGVEMQKFANVYEGDFCHGYNCLTCRKIIDLDQQGAWEEGDIFERLDKNQTPEQLLQKIIEDEYRKKLRR